MTIKERLSQEELSEYWGVSTSKLATWRREGLGPDYIKIGSRVLYARDAINSFEEQNTYKSTSQRIPVSDAEEDINSYGGSE